MEIWGCSQPPDFLWERGHICHLHREQNPGAELSTPSPHFQSCHPYDMRLLIQGPRPRRLHSICSGEEGASVPAGGKAGQLGPRAWPSGHGLRLSPFQNYSKPLSWIQTQEFRHQCRWRSRVLCTSPNVSGSAIFHNGRGYTGHSQPGTCLG